MSKQEAKITITSKAKATVKAKVYAAKLERPCSVNPHYPLLFRLTDIDRRTYSLYAGQVL